ncbi:tetratricopeptide repeat protein [Xanthovirga aplysinae]|uniref:tetratricopeptide repeat protein n=1 Tax=Xanthovirga aplysinae TaxID=2529853 RepID=UPI0012BD4EBD|nr:hypothetical protein [Xanthovirga aplysinae]MTI30620.1 hypothetical protein [Xanthovirga aplysinae]
MKYLFKVPILILGILIFLTNSCQQRKNEDSSKETSEKKPEAISLLGQALFPNPPSEKLLLRFEKHKKAYEADPLNADKIIWFGRFTAYKGDYQEAIKIYSKGIEKYPNDPRMYRHRGHRYISIRKFDLAISDLEKAAKLIENIPNKIEPDGMPNAKNIPVSTLHGNIWYHLGLAYYLSYDMENALRAYKNCLTTSNNSDNLVSATHWIYMILRRMNRENEAKEFLTPIREDLEIIENFAYHKICLFYKGEITTDQLLENIENEGGNDAISYALGNWYFYNNNNKERAGVLFEKLLKEGGWNSFGYIAAEANFAKEFNQRSL